MNIERYSHVNAEGLFPEFIDFDGLFATKIAIYRPDGDVDVEWNPVPRYWIGKTTSNAIACQKFAYTSFVATHNGYFQRTCMPGESCRTTWNSSVGEIRMAGRF